LHRIGTLCRRFRSGPDYIGRRRKAKKKNQFRQTEVVGSGIDESAHSCRHRMFGEASPCSLQCIAE
jgi:hypothetical protein